MVMRAVPLIAAIAAVAFLMMVVPASTADADASDEPVSIDGIFYELESTTATAVGLDVDSGGSVPENLVIPSSVTYQETVYQVTRIEGSFGNNSGILTVTIPDSVTYIGDMCFQSSTLTGFTDFESSKFKAVDGVLYNKLASGNSIIRYPVNKAGDSFTITSDVSQIGENAFCYCKNIKNITFSGVPNITVISASAFEECLVLEKIGYSDLDQYNHLPDSLILIESYAFYRCENLMNMCMPGGLRMIDESAFRNCGFSSVKLNDGITSLDSTAFSNCHNLTGFIYYNKELGGLEPFAVIDGVLYKDGKNPTLVCYPGGKTDKEYTLLDKVTAIEYGAFMGNTYLTTFTANEKINSISYVAFSGCSGLTTVHLKPNVLSIDGGAFDDCVSLKTIDGWTGVNVIGPTAFYNTGLEEITFPDSIRTIELFAFMSSTQLRKITVPDVEVYIESEAFTMCSSLTLIDFLGDKMELEAGSLDIGIEGAETGPQEVTVKLIRTASLPSDVVTNDGTKLIIEKEGDHPYPYENLIGVAICLLTLVGVIAVIREV